MDQRDRVLNGLALEQPYSRSSEIHLIPHERLGAVAVVRQLRDSRLQARRACEALFLAPAIVRPGADTI